MGILVRNTTVRSILIWTGLYMVLQIGVTHVRGVNPQLLSLLAAFPFMFLCLMVIASVTRLQIKSWQAFGLFLVFAIGVLLCASMRLSLGVDFLLMFAGAFLGYSIAGRIREPNLLLPTAIIAGLVDVWGVYYGTTHAIQQKYPEVVGSIATVAVPAGYHAGPWLTVGLGDFVFLGIFLTIVQRFHLNYKRTIVLLYTILTASLVILLFTGGNVPALAPMGIAVVVANIREFKLSRQEWLALLYVVLGIFLLIPIVLLTRHFIK